MGKRRTFIEYSGLPWPELDSRVRHHRSKRKHADFWAVIDQHSFEVKAVEKLIWYDWTAEYRSLGKDHGSCIVESKILAIDDRLRKKGLERDVTLAHEAIHAHFFESGFDLEDDGDDRRSQRNYMTVEWLARKARSDPYVLRALVEGFEFKPLVYDQASRRAFVRTVPDEVVLPRFSTYQQLSLSL